MKISKLFHWLYAILMLLPFAFFVPSVLYYAFNDNATMQTVEVPKYETVAVDFNQKFNIVNIDADTDYNLDVVNVNGLIEITNNTGVDLNNPIKIFTIQPQNIISGHKYHYPTYFTDTNNSVRMWGTGSLGDFGLDYPTITAYSSFNDLATVYLLGGLANGVSIKFSQCLFDLTQMFGSGNEPTIIEFNQLFPNSYYPYTESELMQITYDTGETMQLVENTSIVNYAWESIWNLPLFSWAKVTFIAVPFTYITGLFGLSASNSLNYVFGYFLSISIVWLVFDIIMYVPLLCHRWIDKARIE